MMKPSEGMQAPQAFKGDSSAGRVGASGCPIRRRIRRVELVETRPSGLCIRPRSLGFDTLRHKKRVPPPLNQRSLRRLVIWLNAYQAPSQKARDVAEVSIPRQASALWKARLPRMIKRYVCSLLCGSGGEEFR
jgi:hypothetical protein